MKLTFTTEQTAIDAEKQIWINYIKDEFAKDPDNVGTGMVEYNSLNDLTDDEIVNLKVYGFKNGDICKECGLTENYATVNKAYEINKWFFTKPSDDLMTNVEDYQEEEYNIGWEISYE